MTENTAFETPVVETPDAAVEEPQKRFRFTRKQIAIAAAATAAGAGLILLKVKSNASKALTSTDENSTPEDTENVDSV